MELPPANDTASDVYNGSDLGNADQLDEDPEAPFKSLPFSSYYGHTADVLDLAWSKVCLFAALVLQLYGMCTFPFAIFDPGFQVKV